MKSVYYGLTAEERLVPPGTGRGRESVDGFQKVETAGQHLKDNGI